MKKNTERIKIGIVIPTFNRRGYLAVLLKQLRAEQQGEGVELCILIVDDGCTDDTSGMLALDFPEVRILKGPGNWWWTKSVNQGISHMNQTWPTNYILLLNDDSQVGTGYIRALVESADAAGEDCIIGSLSVTDKKPERISFSGTKKMDWLRLKKTNYFKPFELVENIPATGLFPSYTLNGRGTFIKSGLFETLGLLNERNFPQYGSDDDLALRAWKKGYKVLISYSCKIIDRTSDTSAGTAFRQDKLSVFLKSFFQWNSVNYIPKQLMFFYLHGIKILLPFYLIKFLVGTSYAYFFKYKKLKNEI
jgi:GT2 family glycosyltransferase